MRSRTALILVVFALALGAVLWRWRDPRGERARTDRAAAAAKAADRTAIGRGGAGDLPPPSWFTRADVKPRRIAGRVTLDGKPAAATVTLTSQLTRAGRGKPVEITTGADGVFDLGAWPAATYTIAATAPGVRAAIQPLDLSDPRLAPDTLELRLRTCVARIGGTITDAVGAAIEDATIAQDGVALGRSDARGAYDVCVPLGNLELEYAADGYGAVVLGFFLGDSTTQDVVLVPAAAIAGRVVRADDGEPVAEALVTVHAQEWARDRAAPHSVITDARGAFRIEGLVPGRYRVWAFADALASEGASSVEAQLGVTNEVVVKLVARARVRGVVKLDDQPLPGVSVVAVRSAPASRSFPAMTQADGTFVLDSAPLGDLVFSVEGYEVTSPATYRAEPGGATADVLVQVAAMAALRGVVTRNGLPVEDAMVWGATGNPARTDATGHYEILGLAPGTYQVGAGSDEAGAFTLGTTVTLAAAEQKTVDFELELAAEVSGTVVDAAGKPVKGVFVRWTHTTTQDEGRGVTDAAGRYRCRAMSGGGTYKALVFATQQSQKPFPPAPGTSYPSIEVVDGKAKVAGVTIAIDRQELSLSGVVVDASGAPVVDALVKATATDGREPVFDMWRRLPMTATDADGRFTLGGLVDGTYAVMARAGDGGEAIARDVAAGARNVKLLLARPGSIEGALVGFTRPAVVYATPWNAAFKLLPGVVDGATFRVPGVKPGRYLVNAQNASEGDAALVEVKAGVAAPVTLTARGHGVIEGKVLDWRTKAPLAGATCRAVMSVDGQQGITNWDDVTAPKSDANGRVVIDPAPAGDVTVVCEVRQPRQTVASADVTVPTGGRVTVDLYSATFTVENPGSIGAEINWMTTPPRVFQVVPGSPAARAGMLAGDLVVAVDGESVAGLNGPGVGALVLSHPIGTTASITFTRGALRKTVDVEIEAQR